MSRTATTLLGLVEACDNYLYDHGYDSRFYRPYLPDDPNPHGYMLPTVAEKMPWSSDFVINPEDKSVRLMDSSHGTSAGCACTAAFSETVANCIERDLFASIHGKHSEPFAILGARYSVQVERFAAPLFGIVSRGAHLSAYTNGAAGMTIWVARRSPTSHTYPNMLHDTVAGGVAGTETPFENIVDEAHEEASLPADLIRRDVRAAGVLTFVSVSSKGGAAGAEEGLIMPDIAYIFDIEVCSDLMCTPRDHEVKDFTLMTIDEVKAALLEQKFKTNSAVVMIDFLIRRGIMNQDNEKAYVELTTRMHRRLPFKTARE